ncbi:MAG: hypothetical protein LBK43_07850 [Treponema sp.]|nr:hypothetical protein [Treponema sp.]
MDKTGEFTLLRGVEGPDRDALFEEMAGFGETFAFEGEGDSVHLLSHKRSQEFPACIPQEGQNEAKGSDDLMGVDFFTYTVGGLFFRWLQFDRLAVTDEQGLGNLRLVEDTQGVLSVFVAGNLDKFVQLVGSGNGPVW